MPNNNSDITFRYGTQSAYDALENKDENAFYLITDTRKIYVGNTEYTEDTQMNDNTKQYIDSNIDNIGARIDNIIAHNNDTEGNTELIDIRTGADGTVYASAGDAVRNQLQALERAFEYIEPENKLNLDTITENTIINISGVETANDTCYTSDFIKAAYGDVVILALKKDSTFYHAGIKLVKVSMYNQDHQFISTSAMNVQDFAITEQNTAFIRVSVPNGTLNYDIVSVTLNTVPTLSTISEYFAPYFKILIPELETINEQVQENANQITATQQKDAQQDQEIEQIKKIGVLIEPENKLNLDTITENTIINGSGVETANDTCYTSDFIKAAHGDVVILALKRNSTFYHAGVKLTRVSMYDQNHQFISTSDMSVQDFIITEQNTAFIRVSVPNGTLNYDIVSVTLNTIPTSASITEYFTPYYSSEGVSEETKRARRVLWLGTSIPTYGYPQILGRLCGAAIFNESIGSSGIAKGINANITQSNVCGIRGKYGLYSLCQTVQEKQYMIDHWETIASELGTSDELTTDIINQSLTSSYETILDPYLTGNNAVNLIVLNHAYNDSANETDVLVSDDPFDTHTLEGAYNWTIRHILQANPHIGIVIFGHYSDLPDVKETALNKVAERWNIPYYKLKNDLGWSTEAISTTQRIGMDGEWTNISETTMQIRNMWCADGIHPIGKASDKIAQVSVPTFKNWLTMYCGL